MPEVKERRWELKQSKPYEDLTGPERAEVEEITATMSELEALWSKCPYDHNDCTTDRPCITCGCDYPSLAK